MLLLLRGEQERKRGERESFFCLHEIKTQELKKYKENAEQLNKHLESLNTIYGNMLGAMSYKK